MQINTANKSFKIIFWCIMICYMIILTKLVIFKQSPGYIKHFFLHEYGWKKLRQSWHHANLIPLKSIKLYLTTKDQDVNPLTNLLGNIVGFVPLGFLLPLLFIKLRSFIRTIAIVFSIRLGFETFQLVTDLGYFDVDDLLLNTIGGMIGYLAFALVKKMKLLN